jgi:antitoxin (DNA-binding transcriptional repressor) of toxin-antitoxin stability system
LGSYFSELLPYQDTDAALQDSANERLRIKLGEIAHAIDDDYEVDFELLTVGDLTPAARADLESFQFETRRVRLPHRTGQPTPPLIELRNASREITRALDRGETFIVTRNGVPVGELHPLRRSEYVDTGLAQAALATAARVDRIRFRSDVDRGVDQDPTPRG